MNNVSEVERLFNEDAYNIIREFIRDNPDITTNDTYNDFLNNRNQNANHNNTNHVNTNIYDVSNNSIFNIMNEYNVNILEYSINMREYIYRENNIQNNSTEFNNNFNEYNSNISDYNSNLRRFLDLTANINNNMNNERIHQRNNNIRENRRQFVSPNMNHYRERYTNHTQPNLRPRGIYNYTPRQLLSHFLPNRTFTNVVVAPSERQISEATQHITYNENEEYNNNSCPIMMEDFNNGEQVFQIKHCGHNFREDALRNWFRTNVRCPVCRYDIRDYNIYDVSGNQTFINRNNPSDENIDTSGNDTFINRNTPNGENIGTSGNSRHRNNRYRRLSSVDLSNAVSLSNLLENYVSQHITPLVENINSNLSEFDVIFPIIYYDASGNYRYDSSYNTQF